jgi:hypothetical protein
MLEREKDERMRNGGLWILGLVQQQNNRMDQLASVRRMPAFSL